MPPSSPLMGRRLSSNELPTLFALVVSTATRDDRLGLPLGEIEQVSPAPSFLFHLG